MENNNINLLDLNNDILNIIGGYVKKDNERRIVKEKSFEYVDKEMKRLKKQARKDKEYISREQTRDYIFVYFDHFYISHGKYIKDKSKTSEFIQNYEEYLTLKKLNLKKK